MSNTIVLVNLVLVLALVAACIGTYLFVMANDKKKAAKKIADKVAADLAARNQANLQGWQNMDEVLRLLTTDLHWLAREAGLKDLHRAINAGTISNLRLGQVSSSNMSNHNGLGLYMTLDGQEVAYGIKANCTNNIVLISGVCRIYGE
jgi:hypothetical protein